MLSRPSSSASSPEFGSSGAGQPAARSSPSAVNYLIVEANDVEDTRKQLGLLPFVSNGLLFFEFEPVEKSL
jgi:hypothetical protein